VTPRSSRWSWDVFGCPGPGRAVRAPGRTRFVPIRRTAPREPRLPTQARHTLHDPGEARSDRQPQEARFPRWPATEVRRGRLQRAPRGGVRNQSTQAPPRGRYEIRQARRPLRGDRPRRSHQRVAVTRTFETHPNAASLSSGPYPRHRPSIQRQRGRPLGPRRVRRGHGRTGRGLHHSPRDSG
jgi:hypothetical protein